MIKSEACGEICDEKQAELLAKMEISPDSKRSFGYHEKQANAIAELTEE